MIQELFLYADKKQNLGKVDVPLNSQNYRNGQEMHMTFS